MTAVETVPMTQNLSPHPDSAACAVSATKIYGSGDTEVRALDGVNVAFEKGKFTAIMGPSGSGKSTLMHCMAGLDSLTEGSVYIGDTNLTGLSERELTLTRRNHVGFVFQAYNLIPTLTALENITLPLDLAGAKGDRAWIDEIITITGLGDRVKHRPAELSGGQQQRVAVARALASKPDIIFADEPTGNLDSQTGGEVLDFMKYAVNDLGVTIVMVTHDPTSACYAHRVVILTDGQVTDEVFEPTFDAIYSKMSSQSDT